MRLMVTGFGDDRDDAAQAQLGADRAKSMPCRPTQHRGRCAGARHSLVGLGSRPAGAGTSERHRPGLVPRALRAVARSRRLRRGSSSTARRGTRPASDQSVRAVPDSSDSPVPPVVRGKVAACWCARLTVESALTRQPIPPIASTRACEAVRILPHVPSRKNREWRFHSVCHGPNRSGRARHATPVRYR